MRELACVLLVMAVIVGFQQIDEQAKNAPPPVNRDWCEQKAREGLRPGFCVRDFTDLFPKEQP